MAPISKILALAAALFAAATSAIPMQNWGADNIVYVTVTDVVWTTVDVTATLPPTAAPTMQAPPPPPPITTQAPAPPPATTAQPQTSQGGGSSGGSSFTGDGTYYDVSTSRLNPSSCGDTNDGDTENVVALPAHLMTDAVCGKTINIRYNAESATAKIVDKCPSCQGGSIDMSRHLFGELASLDAGRLKGVTWEFV